MARSHHRPKKHHPQHQQHAATAKAKRKGSNIITIFLAVFGALLGYLVGGIVFLFVGLVVGGVVGYFAGNSIDASK